MDESALREALRALAEQSVQRVAEHDRGWQYFSGATAMQDMSRDQVITELPNFVDARTAFGSSPVVREYYGDGGAPDYEHAWERLALQFIYGFLGSLSQPTFDLAVFEATWGRFGKNCRHQSGIGAASRSFRTLTAMRTYSTSETASLSAELMSRT
jgi:hypothetical protein